jgi:hypothetical protein
LQTISEHLSKTGLQEKDQALASKNILFKVRITPTYSKQLVATFGFDPDNQINLMPKNYLSERGADFV